MIEQLAYEVYKNVGRNKRSVSGKGSHCQKRLSAYSGLPTGYEWRADND
jgi:hypothetical protein